MGRASAELWSQEKAYLSHALNLRKHAPRRFLYCTNHVRTTMDGNKFKQQRATVSSKYPQQQKQQQSQQQHQQQQQQQPQQQQLWQSLSMYSQLVVAPATQVEVAHEVASARQLFYPKKRPMAVEGVVLEGGDFLHLIVGQSGGTCRTVHISADACGRHSMILTITARLEHGATPSFSLCLAPCKNVVLCFADDALLSSKIGRC